MTNSFAQLGLAEPLLRALEAENYLTPTPIQTQAVPHILAGRDLLGLAQTGTGKTAAFALPILQRLPPQPSLAGRRPRALVLTPTRELALQVGESFRTYGRHLALRSTAIFGGVGKQPQVDALARGVDILVATPGRLLDLSAQMDVRFDRLAFLVLDEVDRMLDMGFLPDVKRILALLPKERQTLLFSATMPDDIAHLAAGILRNPVRVEVAPVASTVEQIEQRVIFVDGGTKPALLTTMLQDPQITRALVFARTKHGANRIVLRLLRDGIDAEAIHGNKSQGARQRALEGFRSGRIRVLVATDIAARGIDIDRVSHVINFDVPNEPDTYVHRIGRTARAGASGIALSLCDASERDFLRAIEKLIRRRLTVLEPPQHLGRSSSPAVDVGDRAPSPAAAKRPKPAGAGRHGKSRRHGKAHAHAVRGKAPPPRPASATAAWR